MGVLQSILMVFHLLTAINAFQNDGQWWVNNYEIHVITNKMPSVVIDGFLLTIFEISGAGENMHIGRWLLIKRAHMQDRNTGKNVPK